MEDSVSKNKSFDSVKGSASVKDSANDFGKTLRIGAWVGTSAVQFRLWAPKAKSVEVAWYGKENSKSKVSPSFHRLQASERGYFEGSFGEAHMGGRYKFRLDGEKLFPDPASRFQPEGPHGSSQVVADEFAWTDQNWRGLPMNQLVIYELHIGTFSEAGTFAGAIEHLDHLQNIGINAIEILPIAQFAGDRNWGYDGVGMFAAQNSYGGKEAAPLELKKLIDACHQRGIAVLLDVVYNHLGPEGNYLPQLGPYFQSKYKTPWGEALNYDGEWCDEVRNYFLENARQWLEEFHFDGLRLDAIHAIFDTSAKPFLEELSTMTRGLEKKTGRSLYLIAESEANDSRILQPPEQGGLGLDGQWADDLHHVVHSLITNEKEGYYEDYGKIEQLAQAYQDGVVFHGEYSPYRHRSHGRSYEGIAHSRLVVCSQNHDQIGNRRDGERMITLVGPEKMKLAAACILLSPALPLIFMGEEIAETKPFQYFVNHTDHDLLEAVRKGRKAEFAAFAWQGEAPDPASPETFKNSKLDWQRAKSNPLARQFQDYYRELIKLSKWIRHDGLLDSGLVKARVTHEGQVVEIVGQREGLKTADGNSEFIQIFFSFSPENQRVKLDLQSRKLEIILDSAEDEVLKSKVLSTDEYVIKSFSAVVFSSATAKSREQK